MLIHSAFYRHHFPFRSSLEIQQLTEKDKERLAKYIRDFPHMIKYWKYNAMFNAERGCLGSTAYFDFPEDKLATEVATFANKVSKRCGLTKGEILFANIVLCSKKYNWFWRMYMHPVKDIVEIVHETLTEENE